MTKASDVPPGPGGNFTNSLGMSFKQIQPGTFMMGSPADEPGRDSDETQHQVTLTQAYYIQTTEVTNSQYVHFLNSVGVRGNEAEPWFNTFSEDNESHIEGSFGNYRVQTGYENHPVIEVSWYGAKAFIDWISFETGQKYALPTEAQWEYAARAGTVTPFAFGECLSTDQANYNGNYPASFISA